MAYLNWLRWAYTVMSMYQDKHFHLNIGYGKVWDSRWLELPYAEKLQMQYPDMEV